MAISFGSFIRTILLSDPLLRITPNPLRNASIEAIGGSMVVSTAGGFMLGGLTGAIAGMVFGGVLGVAGILLAYFLIVPLIEKLRLRNRLLFLATCMTAGGGLAVLLLDIFGDIFWEMTPVILIGALIMVAAGRERWAVRHD